MFKEIFKNRKYKHIQYPKKDWADLSREKTPEFPEIINKSMK